MKEHRSLFWPLTFIAAGVIWLLISMGRMPGTNLWALAYIWPYVLIALGVGLILRSLWRPAGMLVSALVVIGAAVAVVYAPQIGWDKVPSWGYVNYNLSGGVRGSGKIVNETRKVSGFDEIKIRFPAEIVISQGATESLTIAAEDNLLPQLTTEVRSGTLYIEDRESNFANRVNPTQPIKINIMVKNLNAIDFSTAGKLTINGLKGDALDISLSGAGDIVLNQLALKELTTHLSGAGKIAASGSADAVDLNISGLGDFTGDELTSQKANIQISGAGTAILRVEKQLDAKISGAGSVNYYGSPTVVKSISGAGSVNQVEP